MRPTAMRSLLYVPGDRAKMLDGALERGADVVVADLEDAVAPRSKGAARRAVATWLAGLATSGELPVEVWVRVNPGDLLADDVGAVTRPGLSGVCLAKAESADELVHLDQLLSGAELAAGMVSGSVGVLPLLESAPAVLAMGEIAAAPRVARLGVGEVDLSSELGVQLGPDEHELLWVRSQLVMYSAAAGLDAPVGPVWTDIEDLAGLRRSSEGLRRLGYVGRACIHPAQIPVVREVFTPSPAEIAQAEHLVERYDAAIAIGQGVIKDDRGAMVDEAVVRAARRTLAAIRRG